MRDGLQHRAALIAALARIALWTLPWRSTQRVLENVTRGRAVSRRPALSASAVARAVQGSTRFVPRATCLVQAITAATLLCRSGRRVELVMGTPWNRAGAFEAHAWLELDGEVVVGGDISNHAELARLFLGPDSPTRI